MQEAGATAVEELAFTLADGVEYVRSAVRAGLDVDRFAPRLSFFFGIGMNLFMEVAKLRARAVVVGLAHAGAFRTPGSAIAHVAHPLPDLRGQPDQPGPLQQHRAHHDRGARRGARGARSRCHTNSFDEALALPTDFSARIARNTQLILREEERA